MDFSEAKRIRDLEREAIESRKELADAMLTQQIREYALEGKYAPEGRDNDRGTGHQRQIDL